jgi:hypothetical protein
LTDTVVVFGAGATKACDGPLTSEILLQALSEPVRSEIQREDYLHSLDEFLVNNFHVPSDWQSRTKYDYPSLPLLLSLMDTAIDRKQPFGPNPNTQDLVRVRQSLEYVIFALLDNSLKKMSQQNCYLDLFEKIYPDSEPVVLSLNYDIIADNALIRLSRRKHPEGLFPDYGCEIRNAVYSAASQYFGKLLKLHGSLNWMYCPGCHRLDLGVAKSGIGTVKVLGKLYEEDPKLSLDERYSCHGSECVECDTFVRPVLITPTHRKDYRNPHVAQVWYQAERALRDAKRVIFIGYSLPDDDVEVVYLLKRSLTRTPSPKKPINPPPEITVVELDDKGQSLRDHAVGARYRSLFGDSIIWRTDGFAKYVQSLP